MCNTSTQVKKKALKESKGEIFRQEEGEGRKVKVQRLIMLIRIFQAIINPETQKWDDDLQNT